MVVVSLKSTQNYIQEISSKSRLLSNRMHYLAPSRFHEKACSSLNFISEDAVNSINNKNINRPSYLWANF